MLFVFGQAAHATEGQGKLAKPQGLGLCQAQSPLQQEQCQIQVQQQKGTGVMVEVWVGGLEQHAKVQGVVLGVQVEVGLGAQRGLAVGVEEASHSGRSLLSHCLLW